MTAALYRLPSGTLAGATEGDQVVVDGAEGHHAADVKRTAVGEQVLLSDGGARLVEATVTAVAPGRIEARIDAFADAGYPGPRFTLVQALAKGDRDLSAIEAATELGIDAVVPWSAARSIVAWRADRAAKAHRKWATTVEAAAKQSRRPVVPDVAPLVTSRALASEVGDVTASGGAVFVLHEDAQGSITDAVLPDAGDVWLIVGPEGGIAPDEVEALTEAGATAVRMGRYVLRSSTAGPAALAVLSARLRWR